MGNCTKLPKKILESSVVSQTLEIEDSSAIKFYVKVSKLKIHDLEPLISKSKKLSVILLLPEISFIFGEIDCIDDSYRWNDFHEFFFTANLSEIKSKKLEVQAYSDSKLVCAAEMNLKSVIDGPVHHNIRMTLNSSQVARVSFDIEILQQTTLKISAAKLMCKLGENNLGNFSTSIKFVSDLTKESCKSSISDTPSWDFQNSLDLNIELVVTMKNIRDAALQIRLYKNHKTDTELAAECWISFTKLFAENIDTLYRRHSAVGKKKRKKDEEKDFRKVFKLINRKHYKDIQEQLWLCGRKVGEVQGRIEISGMPTFVQLISGVNTENGVTVQNINILNNDTTKSKKVPNEIIEIQKLMSKLKETINVKSHRTGPMYEREVYKQKKDIIDKLCELLVQTKKDSMICFTYNSPKSLVKSQKILIELCNYLIEYAPLVNYNIKPYYFKCISLLIERGELDIGHLSIEPSKTALEYCEMMHEMLKLSLSRLLIKGIDKMTQKYVDKSLAISWFRIPEFRETIKELVKKKSYYSIEQWRNIESNLDEESNHTICNPLNWDNFHSRMPKDSQSRSISKILKQESWRARIEKRGIAFFSFFEEWIEHAHKQSASQHFIWSNINGYKVLLKAFLIEMKERNITEYPEALVKCACKILYNPKMLNIMVVILFSKTNIYDVNTVQETFRVLNILFKAYYKLATKLPTTFDTAVFVLGLKICLQDEAALNVGKCLWFIYNQFHLLTGIIRKEIIYNIIASKNFKKYFFHWSKDVRSMFYHLITYRILSLKRLLFASEDDENTLNIEIIAKVKEKLKNLDEGNLKRTQSPYFYTAINEYKDVKTQYNLWKINLPRDSNKLYGCSDTFPYPALIIKVNFLDLSEKRLEEQW